MTDSMEKYLKNAVASSAMEGIIMTEKQVQTVRDIADGKLTLADYFRSLQQKNEDR